MVKKGIFVASILCVLVGLVFVILNNNENEMRIRILSNSNSEIDQLEKQIVKEELEIIFKENNNLNYF